MDGYIIDDRTGQQICKRKSITTHVHIKRNIRFVLLIEIILFFSFSHSSGTSSPLFLPLKARGRGDGRLRPRLDCAPEKNLKFVKDFTVHSRPYWHSLRGALAMFPLSQDVFKCHLSRARRRQRASLLNSVT